MYIYYGLPQFNLVIRKTEKIQSRDEKLAVEGRAGQPHRTTLPSKHLRIWATFSLMLGLLGRRRDLGHRLLGRE
jgi:hypothetical protein